MSDIRIEEIKQAALEVAREAARIKAIADALAVKVEGLTARVSSLEKK